MHFYPNSTTYENFTQGKFGILYYCNHSAMFCTAQDSVLCYTVQLKFGTHSM